MTTQTSDPHAEFPLGPFTPYEENPILRPQGDSWESASVYNPAAVVKDDQVVLLYRAHADDIVSHVGLATSDDGIHFERHPEPVLSPTEPYDEFGARGPAGHRDRRHLLPDLHRLGPQDRAAVPGHVDRPVHVDQARADVPGLQHVPAAGQRRPDGPWSKAGGILPVPIDGRYLMYFGEGSIWYAWSDDLIHWEPCPQRRAADGPDRRRARSASSWSRSARSRSVTNNGLILLLHNAAVKYDDGTVRYTCGQLLFDPGRPDRDPGADEPARGWSRRRTRTQHGLVSNVTFVEGLVHFKDTWFAYYGQSDSTLGVATYQVGERYAGWAL